MHSPRFVEPLNARSVEMADSGRVRFRRRFPEVAPGSVLVYSTTSADVQGVQSWPVAQAYKAARTSSLARSSQGATRKFARSIRKLNAVQGEV